MTQVERDKEEVPLLPATLTICTQGSISEPSKRAAIAQNLLNDQT
jgi:hypothetical protein